MAKVGRSAETDATGEGDADVTDGGALADGDVEGAGAIEGFWVAAGEVGRETEPAGFADGSELVALGDVLTVDCGVAVGAVVQLSNIRTQQIARKVPSRIWRS